MLRCVSGSGALWQSWLPGASPPVTPVCQGNCGSSQMKKRESLSRSHTHALFLPPVNGLVSPLLCIRLFPPQKAILFCFRCSFSCKALSHTQAELTSSRLLVAELVLRRPEELVHAAQITALGFLEHRFAFSETAFPRFFLSPSLTFS